jgi:hypothetical protein
LRNKIGTKVRFAISAVKCPDIRNQLPHVWIAQLLPERWHFTFDSSGNHLMDPSVASVQIMQIGPFIAMRIVSMTMRAIHQKQMPTLDRIDRKVRWLDRSLGSGRKR